MADTLTVVETQRGDLTVEQPGGMGPQGLKGDTGATGAAGADGADGADGAAGADGTDGVGVPEGGTTGQVLAKTSATDFDTEWIDPPEGGGGGGVSLASVFLLMGA